MDSQEITTNIDFLPGLLSKDKAYEVLRLIFEEFRWFAPIEYGFGVHRPLKPAQPYLDTLLDYYAQRRAVTVCSSEERDFILLSSREPEPPGALTWNTSTSPIATPEWRVAHLRQIKQLMTFLDAPLAIAALEDDYRRKTTRRVSLGPDKGWEQVYTVDDYRNGLAGLYWRNFFGPPFVRMFGERLGSLPSDCVKDLGDGIVLVEPYPLPTDADTDAGKARERELIQLLGPECFYDHEHHVPPRKRPDLSDLPSNLEPA